MFRVLRFLRAQSLILLSALNTTLMLGLVVVCFWLTLPTELILLLALVISSFPFLASLGLMLWVAWHTRGLESLSKGNVSLYYKAAVVDNGLDTENYATFCNGAMNDMTRLFGHAPRRQVHVYVLPDHHIIRRISGRSHQGVALVSADTVLVVAKPRWVSLEELTRHELSHLFSWYLNRSPAPILAEGLATWIQGTIAGKSIDFMALTHILVYPHIPLAWLLNQRFFYGKEIHACYLLAGSFTEYLVQSYDLETYWRLYSLARMRNFRRVFTEVFGASFDEAEQKWRETLLRRRSTFGPELQQAVLGHRAIAAYRSGQFQQCIDDGESLCQSEAVNSDVFWSVVWSHWYLRNYDQVVTLLESLLSVGCPARVENKGDVLYELGRAYDLLGRRAEAVSCYRRVLDATDCHDARQSVRVAARKSLKSPYTHEQVHRLMLEYLRHRAG